MNMTEQTQAVFMEFKFTFVHGTAAEIKKSTGQTYRPGGPREKANVEPGVGEIWTALRDGVLIAAAGHQHGGAKGVVLVQHG